MQFKIAAESSSLVKDVPKSCEATHQKLVQAVNKIASSNIDPVYDDLTFRIASYLGFSTTVIGLAHKHVPLLTEESNGQFTAAIASAMSYSSLSVILLDALLRTSDRIQIIPQASAAAVLSMLPSLNYTAYQWLLQKHSHFVEDNLFSVLNCAIDSFDGSANTQNVIDLLANSFVDTVSVKWRADEALLKFIAWLRTPNTSALSNLAKDAHERFITESIDKHWASFETAFSETKVDILYQFLENNSHWMMGTLDKNDFGWACEDGRTEDIWLLYKMRPKTIDSLHGKCTVFSHACENQQVQVIETLLALGSALVLSCREDLVKRLHETCKLGQIDLVKLLYAYDPTLITLNGKPGLESACLYGHVELVEWFYALDSELTDRTAVERPYFEAACRGSHFNVMKVLLRMSSELITYFKENRKVEFLFACYNGGLKHVRSMLTHDPTLVEATSEAKHYGSPNDYDTYIIPYITQIARPIWAKSRKNLMSDSSIACSSQIFLTRLPLQPSWTSLGSLCKRDIDSLQGVRSRPE